MYAEELETGGHEVVLIFDGAGTGWAKKLRDPEHKLHKRYMRLKDRKLTQLVCDFCAAAFKVKDALEDTDAVFASEFEGHPSIRKWADKGQACKRGM